MQKDRLLSWLMRLNGGYNRIAGNGSGIAEGGEFGIRPPDGLMKLNSIPVAEMRYVCPAFSNTMLVAVLFSHGNN